MKAIAATLTITRREDGVLSIDTSPQLDIASAIGMLRWGTLAMDVYATNGLRKPKRGVAGANTNSK